MNDNELNAEMQQWQECVEGLGKYRLPHGKTHICGAVENWGCPYLHPLRALVKSKDESRYVHLCNLREADDGWKKFLGETNSRWDWVFEQIKRQNCKYDFRVTPMPAKNPGERSSFLKVQLDHLVETTYLRINEKNYGFITPHLSNYHSTEYTIRNLRKIFHHAQKQGLKNTPSFLQLASRKEYMPLSMEQATATAFPTTGELSLLENIFINDIPSLDRQKVVLPIGGQGSYAQRVSMEMEYSGIYNILAAQGGVGKVKRLKFW